MEDGETELKNPTSPGSAQESGSTDSHTDDLSKGTARTCTHTHTCNPTSPGSSVHTHTCYHSHTQLICSEEENDETRLICSEENDDTQLICSQANNNTSSVADAAAAAGKPRKRSVGNREAVRKYRERKKAHAAYLEEEVRKLRVLNHHLGRKLQLRGVLEAEVVRLRSLLGDLNRRIDCELGLFPHNTTGGAIGYKEGCYQSTTNGTATAAAVAGSGGFCGANVSCFHPGVAGCPGTGGRPGGDG